MLKITDKFISDVSQKAKVATRKRINYNFHKSYDEVVQRMLNAAEPGTYIRPHKHESPDKVEVFLVLRGKAAIIEFNEKGNITDHAVLDPKKGVYAVEIPPRIWHTFIALQEGTVLYEVKEGPYSVASDKNFATWAPVEGSPEARDYNDRMIKELGL